jgi:diacylglycerol kinase (ATP)
MTSAFVIGRKRKGRGIPKVVRETAGRLEVAGWTVESAVVTKKKELRRCSADAVKQPVDVVVAVGGDGVVLQVVQSLVETPVALGIIPMGTGNLLALNLEIPDNPEKAAAVILEGIHRRIDVGRATVGGKSRAFSVACGVGFDAHVMDATSKKKKVQLGRLAYIASAIQQRDKVQNVDHEITIDGSSRTIPAAQVLVANFGRLGGLFEPRLPIRPDDGTLDVIVITASGPFAGLIAGWEAIRQGRPGHSAKGRVFRAQGRSVAIRSDHRRLVEIDGSVVGKTPVEIEIRPASLVVLAPS